MKCQIPLCEGVDCSGKQTFCTIDECASSLFLHFIFNCPKNIYNDRMDRDHLIRRVIHRQTGYGCIGFKGHLQQQMIQFDDQTEFCLYSLYASAFSMDDYCAVRMQHRSNVSIDYNSCPKIGISSSFVYRDMNVPDNIILFIF